MAAIEDVAFPASTGRPMRAALARPDGGARRPAVIVIHEIFGLNDDIRRITARVADLGFVALAPDLFDTGGPRMLCVLRAFLALRRREGPAFADLEAARVWLGPRGGGRQMAPDREVRRRAARLTRRARAPSGENVGRPERCAWKRAGCDSLRAAEASSFPV